MIRYCLELMQSHARHLEGNEPDETTKSGKSRAEMSLLEAWKAKCPYINALDLKRGKNRPLYSYMSSVIAEGLSADGATPPPGLPTAEERKAFAKEDTSELIEWWRGLSVGQRNDVAHFPLQELERQVWVCPVWEVLLHKLPDLASGKQGVSKRIACVNQNIVLAPELAGQPEAAVRAMQEARATELEWTAPSTPGDDLEAEKQRMVEQLALSILQGRMVEAHKRDTQTEDAERMAQLLIEEEEESKKAQ